MSGKVGINYGVFNSEITKMRSSANSVKFDMSASLSTTDINPFKEYSSIVSDLKSSISQYKNQTSGDIQRIQVVGQEIRDADANISSSVIGKGGKIF
ncbi:TIGR04197 family type VII secretion effector [Enterococcus sp. BWM-S5]|uniref:TIGR04197 family type VII secretion effector n=1 Tax=Enterococcus larvae TaxID=2794352 RepID=A0ABS4CFT0_9ENTE|nr:TIGR04197 family type VII secretion effector [Enterococcus larvae]MBP1044996.1 TIGR04197 family type VII secretion effector [Enterococcus larvae]